MALFSLAKAWFQLAVLSTMNSTFGRCAVKLGLARKMSMSSPIGSNAAKPRGIATPNAMAMNGVLALYLGKAYGTNGDTFGYFLTYIGAVGLIMRAVLLGPLLKRFGEIGVTRLGAISLVLGLAGVAFELTQAGRYIVIG